MLLYVSPPHAHKLYSIAAIIMTFSVEPLDSNLLLMSTNECCRTELKGASQAAQRVMGSKYTVT